MSSTRNIYHILCNASLSAANHASKGAVVGALGAKILSQLDDHYSVPETIITAILGNTLIGAFISFLSAYTSYPNEEENHQHSLLSLVKEVGLSVTTIILGGMLGHVALGSVTQMSLEQNLATSIVGIGALCGISLTLGLTLACCLITTFLNQATRDSDHITTRFKYFFSTTQNHSLNREHLPTGSLSPV